MRFSLHHLTYLELINGGTEHPAAAEKCQESVRRLVAAESPYRPRPAMIWQGQSAQPGADRKLDMQGEFLNPSITHLGCLEVYRVDAANQPTGIDFVSFDELSGVVFARPNLIRAAKLFHNGPGTDRRKLRSTAKCTVWRVRKQTSRFVRPFREKALSTS